MLILADIRPLQDPVYAHRGIGSHSACVLEALRRCSDGTVRIVGLCDPRLPAPGTAVVGLCDEVRPSFTEPEPGRPAVFLHLSPLTHDTLPPARLLDRPNILPCAVIYDFIPLQYPARYLARATTRLTYAAAWKWLESMRLFLPISESCAGELQARQGIDPERIAVTGVALRPVFEALVDGRAVIGPRPPGIEGDYLLFVGGADARKNLETVVRAHALAARRMPRVPTLVVAGGYPHRIRRRTEREVARDSSGRPAVRFLDHVDDHTLAAWYGHASATIAASLAEGFSIPVTEAIACGAPVLVSDIPPHRELVADERARFPATDADALAERIVSVGTSADYRASLVASQRGTTRRFTGEAVGRRVWTAIATRYRAPRPVVGIPRRARPAIALLSPFPPDRSGVADYTAGMAEALARHVDVDVYCDRPDAARPPFVRRVAPIGPAPFLRPDYATVVTVLGNSRYHGRILDLHARFGGPCILHDSRLTDLYGWWRGPAGLRARVETELGRRVSRRELAGWIEHPDSLPRLFLGEVVASATPLIVHSAALAETIERQYGRRPIHLPFSVQRSFTAADVGLEARRHLRQRLAIAPGAIVVVSLGIVSPLKGPDTCIDAIALLRRRGHDVTLRFVGRAGNQAAMLRARAARLGIGDAVHVGDDWIDEGGYRDWLLAADYGIQLRKHRFGQLSGALVDCIAAGLPTVANVDLAAALDAPSTVARVGDDLDAAEVAAALESWIATGGGRDEPAREAYATEHCHARYAEALLAALGIGSGTRRAAG